VVYGAGTCSVSMITLSGMVSEWSIDRLCSVCVIVPTSGGSDKYIYNMSSSNCYLVVVGRRRFPL
jgi:hypothetical protein